MSTSQGCVLVTGGTRGIGSAISRIFHQANYEVIANYAFNAEQAKAFEKETNISTVCFDVSSYTSCQRGIQEVEEKYKPVDILINNAGITRDSFLHKMTQESWNQVIDTNLTSVFNLSRLVVPGMRQRGFGRIINISSINAQKGQVGQTNYAAAKAGMIGFTKSLAQEVAKNGITVNAIAPGYINTDMLKSIPENFLQDILKGIPVGRLGEPFEIARCALFLAHKDSGFITGSTLSANGAQYCA